MANAASAARRTVSVAGAAALRGLSSARGGAGSAGGSLASRRAHAPSAVVAGASGSSLPGGAPSAARISDAASGGRASGTSAMSSASRRASASRSARARSTPPRSASAISAARAVIRIRSSAPVRPGSSRKSDSAAAWEAASWRRVGGRSSGVGRTRTARAVRPPVAAAPRCQAAHAGSGSKKRVKA